MVGKQLRCDRLAWMAAAVLLLAPLTARAETIIFRNDTPMPVVVQVVAGFKGRIQKSPQILLPPRTVSSPITLPGEKFVTVHDANQPTRGLFKDFLPPSQINRAFAIQPNPPARVKLQWIPFPQGGGGGLGGP